MAGLPPLIEMLNEVQRDLWNAYWEAENRAPRAQKLAALDAFLNVLTTSPPAQWFPWARWLAEQVVDQGADLVIRRPLFERAVFPALLAGFRAHLPGSARWLAGLAENLGRSPECREQLPPQEWTELGLLRAAVRDDPGDRRSRLRLIDTLADRVRFSLHELPAG